MKLIRRHMHALAFAIRVAVGCYRNELRQDSLPF